jgi:hypothetical protein
LAATASARVTRGVDFVSRSVPGSYSPARVILVRDETDHLPLAPDTSP